MNDLKFFSEKSNEINRWDIYGRVFRHYITIIEKIEENSLKEISLERVKGLIDQVYNLPIEIGYCELIKKLKNVMIENLRNCYNELLKIHNENQIQVKLFYIINKFLVF